MHMPSSNGKGHQIKLSSQFQAEILATLALDYWPIRWAFPVHQFIAATNANDTVPRFLETGVYEAKPSVQTFANAMDVGAPSNWVRIMDHV
jgi:hypothetical protein